jgi:hypothetical protein
MSPVHATRPVGGIREGLSGEKEQLHIFLVENGLRPGDDAQVGASAMVVTNRESGHKSIKRFVGATTSKDFGLRFFYIAFSCLLYSIWRAVDLLVQVQLTGEYEHSPIVRADNTLTLVKKES